MNYFGDFMDENTKKSIDKIVGKIAADIAYEAKIMKPKMSFYEEELVLLHQSNIKNRKPQRTKEEILSQIDIALDTKDEQWFKELTNELKGME